MLHGHGGNTDIATRFFREALMVAPLDPYIRHEMGIMAFRDEKYVKLA
jgi:hypothetical protein